MLLGKLYLDHTDSSAAVASARSLLTDLRHSLARRLTSTRWMSPASVKVAQTKLSGMRMEIAGPQRWRQKRWSAQGWFGYSVAMAHDMIQRQLRRLGHVERRDDWFDTVGPTAVNAFYNVHSNALFVPAAILAPPFLVRNVARLYGGLGGILGHEMTHGFDDTGRLFSPQLTIQNWWDKHTIVEFKRRAQCIASAYSRHMAPGGSHVDGNRTLGEDIADVGGVRLALLALRQRFRRERKPLAMSIRREFFIAWAQNWCQIATPATAKLRAATDSHAPPETRVNAALAQLPDFAHAFHCPLGSPLHPPTPPCDLW